MATETAQIQPKVFREVFGHLPTGVTVVTARHEIGPVGMAANSVASVSLEPPLVLFCPAKTSTTWQLVRETGRFCVNVMAAHQEALCRKFALLGANRFDGVAWHERSCGPALDEAIAWIECEICVEHNAGDHVIVLGRVVSLEAATEATPLVFFRGRYGTFTGSLEA